MADEAKTPSPIRSTSAESVVQRTLERYHGPFLMTNARPHESI